MSPSPKPTIRRGVAAPPMRTWLSARDSASSDRRLWGDRRGGGRCCVALLSLPLPHGAVSTVLPMPASSGCNLALAPDVRLRQEIAGSLRLLPSYRCRDDRG